MRRVFRVEDIYKTDVYGCRAGATHATGTGERPGGEGFPNAADPSPNRRASARSDRSGFAAALRSARRRPHRTREEEKSVDEIAGSGGTGEIVTRVQHMLYLAEYKRRQAPPGVKVSRRNFGRDRRYPIPIGFVS